MLCMLCILGQRYRLCMLCMLSNGTEAYDERAGGLDLLCTELIEHEAVGHMSKFAAHSCLVDTFWVKLGQDVAVKLRCPTCREAIEAEPSGGGFLSSIAAAELVIDFAACNVQ